MENLTVSQKLNALRSEMEKEGITAYYVPTDDFHGSEYVNDYFKCREYLSGFTGSAGTLVVTMDFAGLWTDGRYFLQAAKQLDGCGIRLMKMGEPQVPTVEDFLAGLLKSGDKLGFDGRCVSGSFVKALRMKLQETDICFEGRFDLTNRTWKDRPALAFSDVWELALSQSGCARSKKLEGLREEMRKKGVDAHFLTSLEDIAWLLNLRGSDIHCNPVFLSYLYVTKEECVLFTGAPNLEKEAILSQSQITGHLKADGIRIVPYQDVYTFAQKLKNQRILLDERIVNARLIEALSVHCELLFQKNPTTLMKAVKNETELANMRSAHIKDGVAVTKFIYYLKRYCNQYQDGTWTGAPLTERKAAEILNNFRKQQEGFLDDSFDSIMAYGGHGAIVHYSATEESDAVLGTDNFLLSDTGAHYRDGTTDITRTISLSAKGLTPEQRKHYTLVLKANLALLSAKFPKGVCGESLDALAREPLWREGLDFNHGTGHGVGYLLSVHEGPNAFRIYRGRGRKDTTAIVPGMITSDEPGLYFEGKYGIRLENLMECVEEENGFLGFRALTFAPFDREAVDADLLNKEEKLILNSYHEQVYDRISIYLGKREKDWLREETAPIK